MKFEVFHSGEDCGLLDYDTLFSGRWIPLHRFAYYLNISP